MRFHSGYLVAIAPALPLVAAEECKPQTVYFSLDYSEYYIIESPIYTAYILEVLLTQENSRVWQRQEGVH